jgi:hypothetical protein
VQTKKTVPKRYGKEENMYTLKEIKENPELAKNNKLARVFLKALKEKEEREENEKKAKENAEKFFDTKW